MRPWRFQLPEWGVAFVGLAELVHPPLATVISPFTHLRAARCIHLTTWNTNISNSQLSSAAWCVNSMFMLVLATSRGPPRSFVSARILRHSPILLCISSRIASAHYDGYLGKVAASLYQWKFIRFAWSLSSVLYLFKYHFRPLRRTSSTASMKRCTSILSLGT